MAKKVSAAQDAQGPITVTWHGVSLTVSAPTEWRLSALAHIEDGQIASFLRAILAADEWAKLLELDPAAGELTELFDTIAAATGLGN